MTDKTIHVAIIGCGEQAIPLIRTLVALPTFKLLGVSDENKDALALSVARELGINTNLSFAELVKHKDLNLVIELSGSGYFARTLEKIVPAGVKVMDEVSARIMFELAQERERLLKVETAYKLTRRYSELVEESNRKLDDKILELSLLNETSKTFSSAFDQSNIAGFIFTLLKKKVNFSIFALLLAEEAKMSLILSSDREIPPEVKEEMRLRMADRYSQYTKKPIDADKVLLIERGVSGQIKDIEPIEPAIKIIHTVPLVTLDRPLGMVGIAFCKDYTLTSDDERFFNIISSQLALFVENDRVKQDITNERNKLEAVLESMSGAVLVIDEEKNISLINPISEILLGIRKEEVLGKNLHEVIPQDEIKAVFDSFRKQKTEFLTREIEITNPKDNIKRIIKANLARVRDYMGNIVGTLLILDDITKAKEIDRMKTEFISITSHELRTPLATIKNCISLIFKESAGPINENQRKFLDIARRNIDRLAALINNLLDLSKIESGKMELERTGCDLNKIVQEVIDTFEPLAKDKNISLKAELWEGLPQIQIDRNKIIQVINNLVSNALKFTEARKSITVSASFYGADKNFIQMSVQDDGVGIEKKDFDKLFKKFQQLDSSMTRKVTGTGLGLAICKQIVELHGGKIWVESPPAGEAGPPAGEAGESGKGSKFSFILPVSYEEVKMGKKIMIIDDEADLCATIKAQLEANGFNVLAALSGQEGLDKVKDYKPDLVILDLMMPLMDGFEVCHRLKKDPQTSSIPVVVLTALEQDDAAKKVLSVGAEGYLVKPFEQDALLFTIREFLK